MVMNRCIAINKNNKRCRAKCGTKLFCCKEHEPLNNEIINIGCYVCSEEIKSSNDLLYFKCKHCFHKECFLEFMKYSTYPNHVCLICRAEVFNENNKKKVKKNIVSKDYSEIKNLHKIIYKF